MFMRYAYLSGFTLCMLLLYWGCRSIENRMPATVDFNYHIRSILVQKCIYVMVLMPVAVKQI